MSSWEGAMRTLNFALISLAALVGACSVKPDEPGLCSLKCGSAIIGAVAENFKIEPVNEIPDYVCPAGLTAPLKFGGPVLVQFLAYEIYKTGDGDAQVENKKPLPYLSFEPLVTGVLAQDEYNPENVTKEGDELKPYRYVGIKTPKSNWCSDSCGVMSLEIVPTCLTAGTTNEINVQVHTGALYSDVKSFSIEAPEADSTTLRPGQKPAPTVSTESPSPSPEP